MKFKDINNAAKMQITTKLAAIGNSTSSVEIARSIEDVRLKLNRQAAVESMEVFEIDTYIYKYLSELERDISQNSVRVAQIRIKKINELLVNRSSLCTAAGGTLLMTKNDLKANKKMMKLMAKAAAKKGFDLQTEAVPVGKLYSDNDLYDILIAQMQDENDSIEQEIAELNKQLASKPNDAYIQNKLMTTQIKFSSIQQRMKIMCDENNRSAYVAAMQAVTETDKQAIASRTVSDAQLQAVQDNYNKVIKDRNADGVKIGADINSFINIGNSAAAGSFATSFGGVGVTGAAGVASTTAAGTANARSVTALYSDVGPLVKALERSRGIYSDKLDELDRRLKAVDRELAGMLAKRRDMSPSERLIFDGKIDSLNSERSAVVTAIKKYRQIQAVNDDKMKLARDLQQQMEINKVEAEAGKLSGALMQDWEQIAMDLNRFVHSGNEELERMADANAVASSEEIEFKSSTGTLKADAEIIVSDDDKYAILERELGLKD